MNAKSIMNTVGDFASSAAKGAKSGLDDLSLRAGKGIYKTGLTESATTAAKIGKGAVYGGAALGAVGLVGNLDEFQYGAGNGVAQTVTGSIGGAGLGVVAGGGAMAVAGAIAKGIR